MKSVFTFSNLSVIMHLKSLFHKNELYIWINEEELKWETS